jgi:hypothetical protein
MLRRVAAVTVVLALVIAGSASAQPKILGGCGLGGCNAPHSTLGDGAKSAAIVLVGSIGEAREDLSPNAAPRAGTTEIRVLEVLKDHSAHPAGNTVSLPRLLQAPEKGENLFLLFADVENGRVDYYRGCPLRGKASVRYLRDVMKLTNRPIDEQVRLFLGHVDSADPVVAEDAFEEINRVAWKDLVRIAPQLDRARVRQLATDPNGPPGRVALFATLLGATGSREEVEHLTAVLDRSELYSVVRTGALIGLILLDHPSGLSRLNRLIRDPKAEFQDRLSGLWVVRFFGRECPHMLSPQELNEALDPLLDQTDLADIVIHDLARWQRWEKTDRVLAKFGSGRNPSEVKMIKHAVCLFALSLPAGSKERAKAEPILKAMRAEDPEWVSDVEEMLRAEADVESRKKATPKP